MSKTIKTIFWIIIAIIIIILVIVGLNTRKSPVVEGETIKIGVSVPLTGEGASYGQASLAGVKLAQKEINEKGGISGRQVQLIVEDNQCNAQGGLNAMNKLINIDNILAVSGITCSASAGSSLPIAQNAGVPVILAGASAPHLSKVGDYIFRNTPSDALQGKFVAQYFFDSLKKEKAGVLFVKNDLGQGLRDMFVSEYEKLGGQMAFDEGIIQETIDIKTPLVKIKDSDVEALYFPVYPNNAVAGLKQMKEMDLDIMVFGSDSMDTKEVKNTEQANDLMFSLVKTNYPKEFQQKAGAMIDGGYISPVVTPYYYDALYILKEAIERAGSLDREAIRDELAKTSYKGVALPLVEFDENGDLKDAEFEVRIIKDGQSVPYVIE